MTNKVLIALQGNNDVAQRFDLATEALIATLAEDRTVEEKIMVLPRTSAKKLCHMVLSEDVGTVICGGIEEGYFQCLKWKRVKVLDSVMGPFETALERFREGSLQEGSILFDRVRKGRDGD